MQQDFRDATLTSPSLLAAVVDELRIQGRDALDHSRCGEVLLDVRLRPSPEPLPQSRVAASRAMSRAKSSGDLDGSPVCSCRMMSPVPPLSMPAMGTPSAPASSSTRLSDSGPCDGRHEQGRVGDIPEGGGAVEAAREAQIDLCFLRLAFNGRAVGSVADRHHRPCQPGARSAGTRCAAPLFGANCPTSTAYGRCTPAGDGVAAAAAMTSSPIRLGMI